MSNYDNSQDPNKQLIQFIKHLKEDLELFLKQYEHLFPEYPELYNLFDRAWEDLYPNFAKIIYNLEQGSTKEKLQSVGLVGAQLELKLHVYYLARDELQEALNSEPDDNVEKNKKKSRLKRLFGWLFANGDTILGSLGTIGVPGVDAVSEFKEVAEKLSNRFRRK